jgi:hypothetical protein
MVNAPKRLVMGQRGSRDAYESAAYARKTPPAARLGVKPKKLPVALDRSVEVGNASRTCSLLRLVVRPTCLLGVQVAESGRSSNDGYKRLRRISSVPRFRYRSKRPGMSQCMTCPGSAVSTPPRNFVKAISSA